MWIPKIGRLPTYPSRNNRASALYGLWEDYKRVQDQSPSAQPPADQQPAPPPPATRLISNPTGGSVAYLLRQKIASADAEKGGPAGGATLVSATRHQGVNNNARQLPWLLTSHALNNAGKRVPIDLEKELKYAKAAAPGAASRYANARIRALGWLARKLYASEDEQTPSRLM